MSSKRVVIQFSYDILSPWSYLAYAVLKRYRSHWNYDLVLNPIWLAGVMAASKNNPPFKVPNKGQKMVEELPLMARFFGVVYHPIKKFPPDTLNLMRFLAVVREKNPGRLEIATDKLWESLETIPSFSPSKEAVFVNQVSPEDVESVTQGLTPNPFSLEELQSHIATSQTQMIKDRVKKDCMQLVEGGAFGAPWIEVLKPNGERLTLFGSDRFEFLAHWLGETWLGPVPDLSAKTTSKDRYSHL
ncbi:hypothetical protein O181_019610 [Austropuccinia psidii MF-1]|uniref:Glutathione S-transferase kappa 1 n=1 Tax=Austropuccinia psidii MF-1 TaxID=1389203 RepID=A0A9Q3CC54_9BASI|nr:hypothetical protein [Austropuccinia psidii MF-1]